MSLCYGTVTGQPSILITDAALAIMLGCRQAKPSDKEAGGQLFAEFYSRDVVIVEATPPTLLVVPVKQTVTYRASFGHVELFQEYRKPLRSK